MSSYYTDFQQEEEKVELGAILIYCFAKARDFFFLFHIRINQTMFS